MGWRFKLESSQLINLLARQAIYDRDKSVYAYELLYRDRGSQNLNTSDCDGSDAERKTPSVIAQLFINLDMNTTLHKKPAFINFTYKNLIDNIPLLLPKDQIVIEVLETVTVDVKIISRLKNFRKKGYKIALDDFVYKKEMIPLMMIADIIKLDVFNQNSFQIIEQLKPLRDLYKGKLLAEKIETREQFECCKELGFDFFQGFFLNKPEVIKGKELQKNKTQMLRLLAEINSEKNSLIKIEEAILQVPKLSYRILKLSQSVSFYVGKKIGSLLDAITQLGLKKVRNWITMILLVSVDNVASDLIERTLIRAKMCERLAVITHYPDPHLAFTAGILSTIDALLNEPLAPLIEKLNLSDILNSAIIDNTGDLGVLLKITKLYERGAFNELSAYSQVSYHHLVSAYLEGIGYADNVLSIIK